MRFTPYLFSDDSSSDEEIITETESDQNSDAIAKDDDNTTLVNEVTSLTEILERLGLEKRFNLVSSIYEKSEELGLPQNESSPLVTMSDFSKKDLSQTDYNQQKLYQSNDPTNYITSSFLKRRQQNKNEVESIIKAEEDRVRLLEEERQRKIAEEKKRKEEEERKIREEKERRAKEEAERKRLEEEKRKREAEEERLRKEQREKEMKEKLAKEMELKKLKEKEDLEKRKAEEARRVEEEAKNSIYKPREIERQFLQYIKNKEQIEINILKPVADNKELKKAIGAHKRKINPKFGQLTNSQEQLTRITREITDLLSLIGNELARSWILNFVADAIIAQAETEVSVKPKSSVPLAKLTLNLMILYPELSQLLLIKFYTKCPMLIGYSCSQDTEEGRVRMGWNRDEDTGKWEKEASYNERLSGISTFYAVINRLKLDETYLGFDPSSMKHPLPIRNSWVFLARMVDLPPSQITEIHYVIVGSWWDACCKEFIEAYGKQARKLLFLVSTEWTSIGNKSSAGRVRLNLLSDELSKGVIDTFPQMER